MNTIYDLLTMALFAGLVVLFLQRSASEDTSDDHLYRYLPPAVGLAAANWCGNHEQDFFAIRQLSDACDEQITRRSFDQAVDGTAEQGGIGARAAFPGQDQ